MFDTALIESGVHHGDHSTVRKLPFAIGFHAAVIGALVSSALISTVEPPEPVIPIAFPSFKGGPPPEPPGGGGAKPVRVVIDAKPARIDAPPTRMPERVPEPEIDEPSQGAGLHAQGPQPGDESGGGASGSGDVPGGTGPQDAGPGGDIPGEILIPNVGGVTVPELIEGVQPVYPETSRKLRQEGTVVLEAIITPSGTVDEVRVVASRGLLLDEAAMAAVRQWRYRPATLRGRAVAVRLTVTVRFGLNG